MGQTISQTLALMKVALFSQAVGKFALDRGYTLIRNLTSHGVGRSLHEELSEIAT